MIPSSKTKPTITPHTQHTASHHTSQHYTKPFSVTPSFHTIPFPFPLPDSTHSTTFFLHTISFQPPFMTYLPQPTHHTNLTHTTPHHTPQRTQLSRAEQSRAEEISAEPIQSFSTFDQTNERTFVRTNVRTMESP